MSDGLVIQRPDVDHHWFVGWAKAPGANAPCGVPTIQPCTRIEMVGTSQGRLCPPYDYAHSEYPQSVGW
jgi:hypothetical protein